MTMYTDDAAGAAVDAYIEAFPADVQDILARIRAVVREAAPDAVEKLSYGMPTFWQNGNLVHFAAFKTHIGFYPTPRGISEFGEELAPYKSGKGSIRFPLDRPIPYGLIGKIARFRVSENALKAAAKSRK
jgi:uncharacterized protein YdhG (YjbR/CyaY superfamily)